MSIIGEGNGTLLQYSCLENPMDGGAWWTAVHGVARSRTQLRDFTFTFHFHALEKEMATHSSVLAWRIPGTGESGGLPSKESHRVGHDWLDLAAEAAACPVIGDTSQPSHSWLPPSPSAFNLSQYKSLFQWVSSLHQVAKYWSFSFRISTSNEYSELTSFKIDWFDLLAVQGTLKSLLQHHSSKTSVLWCSAFFIVRLSPPHVTTGKTTALTISTFVGKVIFAF